jgi:hypothetical protein
MPDLENRLFCFSILLQGFSILLQGSQSVRRVRLLAFILLSPLFLLVGPEYLIFSNFPQISDLGLRLNFDFPVSVEWPASRIQTNAVNSLIVISRLSFDFAIFYSRNNIGHSTQDSFFQSLLVISEISRSIFWPTDGQKSTESCQSLKAYKTIRFL